MTAERLPRTVREFADYLAGLLARLDQGEGWSGVFWRRDPVGMRACLDGHEVPPWDVVEALLDDHAARYGAAAAERERARARALHAACVVTYDAVPGSRALLGDRLDAMLAEQRQTARRLAELDRLSNAAASPDEAGALGRELAWVRDDHRRATARCAELRARIAALTDVPPGPAAGAPPAATAAAPAAAGAVGSGWPGPAVAQPDVPPDTGPADPPVAGSLGPAGARGAGLTGHASRGGAAPGARPRRTRSARPRGARFAGAGAGDDAAAPPVAAGPPVTTSAPRGARFAGGARETHGTGARPLVLDEEAQRAVGEAVADLRRLRAAGRSGAAHVVLAEAAGWDAERFPLLAGELSRAGMDADWTTLLWEVASLPTERLVVVAGTLTAAGLDEDGIRLLRQGVARPASDVAAAVLALDDEGRGSEVAALLDACVRTRTAEQAARCAELDPVRLVPLFLRAARAVSQTCHWDVLHALRVAGLAT